MLRAALAALLLLAAVSTPAQDQPQGDNASAASAFVFKDTKGHLQRLSDYRGKWVLVNFWATWCPPCLREVPDLIALHEAHKSKDLIVIGVALDSTKEAVQRFVAKHGVTYPVVVGDYKQAEQVGEIEGLPTTYLFDPTGKMVVSHTGIVTRAGVEDFIRAKPGK